MSARNAFYAQSGGVTAVINATACGVIETARKHRDKIKRVTQTYEERPATQAEREAVAQLYLRYCDAERRARGYHAERMPECQSSPLHVLLV